MIAINLDTAKAIVAIAASAEEQTFVPAQCREVVPGDKGDSPPRPGPK